MQNASNSSLSLPARASYLWLEREDNLLFEVAIGTSKDCSILDIAKRMSRSPIAVAKRVLDSEIPDMVGFDVDELSEEEAEFLGLALSGVPLQASLLWCTASDQRPDAKSLEAMIGDRPDMRPAMYMAREAGIWLSGAYDEDSLLFLAQQDQDAVNRAVAKVLARFDAPIPKVVANQILGLATPETPISFAPAKTPCASKPKAAPRRTTTRKKSSGFSSDAARRKYWAKRNASKRKAY